MPRRTATQTPETQFLHLDVQTIRVRLSPAHPVQHLLVPILQLHLSASMMHSDHRCLGRYHMHDLLKSAPSCPAGGEIPFMVALIPK